MSYLKKDGSATVSASSMADVAFLLLAFFLMTTVIKNEKGLMMMLPPIVDITTIKIPERNLFTVQINSQDQYLVEGIRKSELTGMTDEIKTFILNYGQDKNLSDHPTEAIVSLKTDRGTSYRAFISTLDQIQQAYYEIYAERAGITAAEFRSLDQKIPEEKLIHDKARAGIPMNISIADPTRSGH